MRSPAPYDDGYGRDAMGRVIADNVENFGSGIDTAVQSTVVSYDDFGRVSRVPSRPRVSGRLSRCEPRPSTASAVDAVAGNVDPSYLVAHSGLVTRDDYAAMSTRHYGYRYTYDAWNRLVRASTQSAGVTVAEYRYNGLGQRIGWKARFDTGLSYANNLWRYFQYNERWQQVGVYYEASAGANTVGAYAVETYLYHTAGRDGRGGSSYIDDVVFRDRDRNSMGSGGDATREERCYYLQNWRHDVVGLVTTTGAWVERYRYDAYGRPESYSVADVAGSGGGGGGPDGVLDAADTGAFSATGGADWNSDLGSAGGSLVPDNAVNSDDAAAFTAIYAAGHTGGIGLMSDLDVDNRKGLAGYEFDPVLAESGKIDGNGVPLYHVRHRALNSYSGKWVQKDPMGYVDGMDLYEYCGSDAIDFSDSDGQAVNITTVDCRPGVCGDYRVDFDFVLSSPARCDGYFIQHVYKAGHHYKCNGFTPVPDPEFTEYWESWFVPKGQTRWDPRRSYYYETAPVAVGPPDPRPRRLGIPVLDPEDATSTDTSSRPARPGTRKGSGITFGTIKFFCQGVTGRYGINPTQWRDSHPDSRNLLSTRTRPTWWDDMALEGPAERYVQWSWNDCCNGRRDPTELTVGPAM